jgi:hypothetical protein
MNSEFNSYSYLRTFAHAQAFLIMPRDAITLADVRSPTIEIVCEPCRRRGRYNVKRLIAKHGPDMRLPELRTILANCPKSQSFSIYDRCKVRYARY